MLPHNGSAQMSQDVLRNETTSVATCLKIQFVESFGPKVLGGTLFGRHNL